VLDNIFKFYTNEALKQFYKIVGALDIVGNPTMLFSSLFSGVRDFILTPSKAFIDSPTDPSRLGLGVAKVSKEKNRCN
jgi:vacuolar protein sorting-associated protein 13A/C